MKTLVFLFCFSIYVLGVQSKSKDKDLILGGINVRSTTTTVVPDNDENKFNDVVDEATLNQKIMDLRGAFTTLQGEISSVKGQQHDDLEKSVLAMLVQTLIDARDGTTTPLPDGTQGIKDLKTCIVLLRAKAIGLENILSKTVYKQKLKDINDLEAEIHDELEHLLILLHTMDCKLKRTTFNDFFDESKALLISEISQVGTIHHFCDEFNNDCAERFKEAKVRFTEFMENNVEELKKQLKEIVHLGCLLHNSQKKVLEGKIDSLEQQALSWIHELTHSLKALVELEIDTLSSSFEKTCDAVNTQRLLFKDNKGTPGEVTTLGVISGELTTLSTTADTITTNFLTAYDVLLHLKGLVAEKDFNNCYDKASELYYLVQGFKLQIDELAASVTKQSTLVGFNTMVTDFIGVASDPAVPTAATGFTKAKEDFIVNLEVLKGVGLSGMCGIVSGTTTFATDFGTKFGVDEGAFDAVLITINAIQTNELPKLVDCPAEHAEKSAQVTALKNEVLKYQKNAVQQKCFGNNFDTRFC